MPFTITRRGLLSLTAGAALPGPGGAAMVAAASPTRVGPIDGPASPLFTPIALPGSLGVPELASQPLSQTARDAAVNAPDGACVCWGIPFSVERVVLLQEGSQTLKWSPVAAPWLVFMHTCDVAFQQPDAHGIVHGFRGSGLLNEHVADYVMLYADGTEERAAIRRRHQVGMMSRQWGECCFQAVAHQRPFPFRTITEQPRQGLSWGPGETRAAQPDLARWTNWLWAWENPHPERPLAGVRLEHRSGALICCAVTAGRVSTYPLRWETRRKAILRLPDGQGFHPDLDGVGQSEHVKMDLGQVISLERRRLYPDSAWPDTYNNRLPALSGNELLVEYTCHPEARFVLPGGRSVAAADVTPDADGPLSAVAPATRRVAIRVVEKGSRKPVPVKLHLHGAAGEQLQPLDRARIPNDYWYEDWSVDFVHAGQHRCTYITGETAADLPLGPVYLEASKGFEIAPVRKVIRVTGATKIVEVEIERALDWRARGWVTADTHVHFLSPTSAHLEGSAEGVNVVNLLASQWGELMTNAGDFDGRTTYGSRETGHDGEWLVRVGTENRQHVMGHISLLGYNGSVIAPMTVGGPDESALGDPVDVLLTEWARQCLAQGGLVVVPHFPNPRAENAAAIVQGQVDGLEMTSWGNLYSGIDPYSLSDWYRYLNCGIFVACVAGTDKMSANTPVGAIRTYAKVPAGRPFDYEAWKDAVRSGNTFATYGPLVEFSVEGKPAGSRIKLGRGGGTLQVEWQAASVTTPMTRVELVVNGEVRESRTVGAAEGRGNWSVKVEGSSWLALLVRGRYADKPEMIAAHTSPVMAEVSGKPAFSAPDALTIVEQIEGAMAFLDTVGTRAEAAATRRMRLLLTQAHREMHNKLHRAGVYHDHTAGTDHTEHH
ncbi:MAG: CehA/McbA family metallohydrolase [Armatimonadetes bacterium]|nr:CehA/McbA family metallohydrolase [Armatimonadota bacterium]